MSRKCFWAVFIIIAISAWFAEQYVITVGICMAYLVSHYITNTVIK